jgi:AraC-like DNA-binding protein
MSSLPRPLPVRSSSFDAWVESCQIAIARQWPALWIEGDTPLDLVASLPDALTDDQQARAGHLLARLFCRFVSMLDGCIVSDLARRALADDEMREWFAAAHRLAGVVVSASAVPGGPVGQRTPHPTDARVERALSEIDQQFMNPRFGLRAAARSVALSDCRLTQLLKATTGRTFGAHLHHRRIAEARTLLNGSALSIKEIASRVGYQSTTQLDRHFKKITRHRPSAYRAASRRSPQTERR